MSGAFHYALPTDKVQNSAFDNYINKVCDASGILKAELIGHGRRREIVDLRHLMMTIAYHEFGLTVKTVGKMFNRDHSSVVHAKDKMKTLLSNPKVLKQTPFLHQCVLIADQEIFNIWGHNFNTINTWLIQKK